MSLRRAIMQPTLFGNEKVEQKSEPDAKEKPKPRDEDFITEKTGKEVDLSAMFDKQFPFTKSLYKSIVQKNVRRCRPMQAVRSAFAHMQLDFVDFVRRLPIVVLEDALLHPKFDEIVWIMKRASRKSYIPTDNDINLLLNVVYDIAKVEWRDVLKTNVFKSMPETVDLPSKKACSLINAILLRSRYGGMQGDVSLLKHFASVWYNRFSEDTDLWLNKIDDLYKFPEDKPIVYTEIEPMQKTDVLLEAVDFHCSPILNIMKSKSEYQEIAMNEFGIEAEELLKSVIWIYRSSINHKKDIILDRVVEAKFSSPEKKEFYDAIEPKLKELSRWYLRKQAEK